MKIIPDSIQKYSETHTSAEPDLLSRLNRETHLKMLYPRMISGHHQGRFLSMISKMVNPQRILEIGTFTGYSAICLAEGLVSGGRLDTIDINDENEELVRQYLQEADLTDRVSLHFGDAMKIIPTLEDPYDLVFIDADKENYIHYFEMVIEKIPAGGIILVDNVLWSGKVLDPGDNDKESEGIRLFNDFVQQDARVDNVLLTLRDGLMMLRKK